MSDRITSKDGKYEGVLQETDGNFVVHRLTDGWPIAVLGATDLDPIKPEPVPEPRAPPEIDISGWRPPANQRSLILETRENVVAMILLIGLPLLGILVWKFVF